MSKLTLLNPAVYQDVPPIAVAPQLAGVRGARVAFVDNSKVNADVFIGRIGELLGERHGAIAAGTVRKLAPKDDLSDADIEELASYDAVVQCIGD
jgi:hypothetical protein